MPLINSWRVSAAYKTVLSVIGWVSIVAMLGVFDGHPSWTALEMFTTQSNILATSYFTVAAARIWAGQDRSGTPFAPAWKGIATMSVTIPFLVAWLVLRMPSGSGTLNTTSRVPYPFLDFESLGVGTVALNVVALAVGVLALGFIAVALDHLRARLEARQGHGIR